MANADRRNGFVPIGTMDGSAYVANLRPEVVDSSNGTAFFIGDAVLRDTDGKVSPAPAGSTQTIGVCRGVVVDRSVPLTEHPGYLPASTAGTILVEEGPNVIYEIQEDSDTLNLATTAIGSNVDFVAGAGSTATGVSGYEIDSETPTNTTDSLRVVQFIDRPNNTVGANARWGVIFNQHAYKTTTGLGV